MKNPNSLYPSNFFVAVPILRVAYSAHLLECCGGGIEMPWILVLIASLFTTAPAHAGVPQVINPRSGATVGWDDPTRIPAIFDNGPLGQLSNEQARALVEAMMDVWGEVPTSRAAFAPGGVYDRDITSENVTDFVDGTICTDDFPAEIVSMQNGESPIIFDNDGSIIDLLAGVGASRKIVGKAALRCYTGTIDDPIHATQAFAIFNGLFLDGKAEPEDLDINSYAGIILHELGHFLGLHHSMVNEPLFAQLLTTDTAIDNSRYIPIMFPLVSRSSVAATVLKPDDIAAISALYPEAGAENTLASIHGTIYKNTTAGFRGANVVARRTDDPLCYAVSTISGRYCTPLLDDANRQSLLGNACKGTAVDLGTFQVEGLTPGDYTVEVSEIASLGGARENMFPKSGDLTLPGPAEFYSGSENDRDPIDDKTVLIVNNGQSIPGIDIYLNVPAKNAKKLIAVDTLIPNPDSDCGVDPVDYNDLLAAVATSPDASQTVVPLQETSAATGSGCAIIPRAVHAREGRVMGWCLVGVIMSLGLWRSRRRVGCVVVMIVAVSSLSAGIVHASSILPATPHELAALAGQAFAGTCESVEQRIDQRGLMIYDVTYRVDRMLKGTPQARVNFRVVTSIVANSDDMEGSAAPFVVGSQDILFLYPESQWGYTSPVAGAQGRFQIWHDPDGNAIVRNPFDGNATTAAEYGKAAQSTQNTAPTITPTQLVEQFQQILRP